MSGTFNSNTNATPAEPSKKAQAVDDLLDAPITPLPVKPLVPEEDDAKNPILASSNDGAHDLDNQPFKPQVFRRKSNNYEDVARASSTSANKSEGGSASVDLATLTAQAKTILDPSSSDKISDLVDTNSKQKGPEGGAKGVGGSWKPMVERQQSWDQQDWKHDLQMKVAGKPEEKDADGFTETGSRHDKRYSQS